jgi:hypothetical protein
MNAVRKSRSQALFCGMVKTISTSGLPGVKMATPFRGAEQLDAGL